MSFRQNLGFSFSSGNKGLQSIAMEIPNCLDEYIKHVLRNIRSTIEINLSVDIKIHISIVTEYCFRYQHGVNDLSRPRRSALSKSFVLLLN